MVVLINYSPHYFLEQGLSLNFQLDWLAKKPQRSTSPRIRITDLRPRDLNSHPHAVQQAHYLLSHQPRSILHTLKRQGVIIDHFTVPLGTVTTFSN